LTTPINSNTVEKRNEQARKLDACNTTIMQTYYTVTHGKNDFADETIGLLHKYLHQ
jgi:hypothetical protein